LNVKKVKYTLRESINAKWVRIKNPQITGGRKTFSKRGRRYGFKNPKF
jgi:hypothetical protein